MTKRASVGWIYFVVVICTLLLRIASSLDIYSVLGIADSDAFFSCVVQIAIFAFLSVFLYSLGAKGRGENAKDIISDFGFKKISAKNWLFNNRHMRVRNRGVERYLVRLANGVAHDRFHPRFVRNGIFEHRRAFQRTVSGCGIAGRV